MQLSNEGSSEELRIKESLVGRVAPFLSGIVE